VVPLGIPLFAGPGAITTVMIYISFATTSGDELFDLSSIFLSIVFTVIASYFLLRYAEPIFSRMGKSGAGAFTRIMGLLLAAIAIEFIITGTFSAIDSWYHIVP
jgi:multiple antibiotic resistance protein